MGYFYRDTAPEPPVKPKLGEIVRQAVRMYRITHGGEEELEAGVCIEHRQVHVRGDHEELYTFAELGFPD
jgi:hypothetical protein